MIPELPFNQRTALRTTDLNTFRDRLSDLMPRTMDFSIQGNRSEFASSKAKLELRGMTLVALSHTPYQLDRSGCIHPEIWVPFSGEMVASDGQSQYRYGGKRAYFCVSEIRNIRTTTVSALGMRFDMRRLNVVHAAMVGSPYVTEISPHSRVLELAANGLDFSLLAKNLLSQVDALQANVVALERLAIEDSFYRLAVSMLQPESLQERESSSHATNHARERVAQLCDYILGHLQQPLSLTDMEQISGLSARVLQYNFQKAFGMRPKQWLQKQRLHAARAVIVESGERVKLTALAYEFCFPSPSVFSRAYQTEFGELPSETLAGKSAFYYL